MDPVTALSLIGQITSNSNHPTGMFYIEDGESMTHFELCGTSGNVTSGADNDIKTSWHY